MDSAMAHSADWCQAPRWFGSRNRLLVAVEYRPMIATWGEEFSPLPQTIQLTPPKLTVRRYWFALVLRQGE